MQILKTICVLLVLVALAACGSSGDRRKEQGDVTSAAAPPVEALQARSGSLPLEERLSGVVKARNQVAVRPEIAAPVVAVLVESGEAVRQGQPLVRLDDTTVRQQLRQSEASLRLSEAAALEARAEVAAVRALVTRNRTLAAQELIPALELETQEARLAAVEAAAAQAVARVEEARATVEERRAALARTTVRSPVTGHVGQRQVEVGMQVDPGTVLFLVGDLEALRVEVSLTERMLAYLAVGQTALLTAPGGAAPLRAEISRISPFLQVGSFSTIGEIDLEGPEVARLRPGMFVRVDILYGETEEATLVPASALWDDPRTGVDGIFVVEGLPADLTELSEAAFPVELRPVEVLAEGREAVGVGGVAPGEWVVTVGQHLLAADDVTSARVRATSWERVLALQGLQQEDLLRGFLDRQQQLAKTLGPGLPPEGEYFGEPAAATPRE
jgi:RND family efflux transporter MFP subunit